MKTVEYRIGFPSARRASQCKIANLPPSIQLIERFAGEWWILGDRADLSVDPSIPYSILLAPYHLQGEPDAGFYVLHREQGHVWYLGADWEHVELWFATGMIHSPPAADASEEDVQAFREAISVVDEEDQVATGRRLAELRVEAGLTQEGLGEILGVDYRTVANWEKGRREFKLSPKKMLKARRALKCSLEDLAGEG